MIARRPTRPLVESLELRWLPSGLGVHPAAEVSVLATKVKHPHGMPQPLSLHGTLNGTTSLPLPTPATAGATFVSLIASGRLGTTKIALNASVRVDLIQTPGSSFALTVGATKGAKHGTVTLQVHATQTNGPLSYTITGGTQAFKGSTGSGTITTTLPQGPPTGPTAVPVVLTFS